MVARVARLPNWVAAVLPALLIAALVFGFVKLDPIGSLREVPPVEAIAFERTVLTEGHISLHVRNDGPDPVTIAQVMIDDAYWNHEIGDRTLGRLESTSIDADYPWAAGNPLSIGLVTSTGIVIQHNIEVASLSPSLDGSTLGIYALLGLYIGVIPIAVGLLWFPALRRASQKWLTFFLAFTVGLLVFLLVDTVSEGLDIANQTAAALNGLGVFFIGALLAVSGLAWLSSALDAQRKVTSGLLLAYLIASGIGLHNLGEGLAVGAALTSGEVALGTFLVVGFALHNTTEGLAIVAPLGAEEERPGLRHFVALGAIAGLPTILGAWAGGFAFSPVWGSFAFGIAAGAIAQVIWAISRSMRERAGSGAAVLGFCVGLVAMYATGLLA
ncbi:MAG: zinc transporter, family [Actinomycetota bacterium]|jgi:zinc transporter ZupT|nr:zinc transporter, family [Actinomycetota bacterium]